jgi:hypothetical protein
MNLKPEAVEQLERVLSPVEQLLPKSVASIDWAETTGDGIHLPDTWKRSTISRTRISRLCSTRRTGNYNKQEQMGKK